MLPLVDHNQVKMVFASRPQKWGRIGGKEVDLGESLLVCIEYRVIEVEFRVIKSKYRVIKGEYRVIKVSIE